MFLQEANDNLIAAATAKTLVSPTKKTKRRVGYGLTNKPSQIEVATQGIKRIRLDDTSGPGWENDSE